jgi:hypothetical protein
MSLAEIKALDIGKSEGRAFAGERIPTMDEVFSRLAVPLLGHRDQVQSARGHGVAASLSRLIDAHGLADRVGRLVLNPSPLNISRPSAAISDGHIWTDSPELPAILRGGAGPDRRRGLLKPDHAVLGKPRSIGSGRASEETVAGRWTIRNGPTPHFARRARIVTNRPQDMVDLWKGA